MSPVKSDLLKIDAIDIFCNYAYFYDCLQGSNSHNYNFSSWGNGGQSLRQAPTLDIHQYGNCVYPILPPEKLLMKHCLHDFEGHEQPERLNLILH